MFKLSRVGYRRFAGCYVSSRSFSETSKGAKWYADYLSGLLNRKIRHKDHKESLIAPGDKVLDCSSEKDQYSVPKYPIILCHGFSGFDRLIYIPALTANPFIKSSSKDKKMVKKMERESEGMTPWEKKVTHVEENTDKTSDAAELSGAAQQSAAAAQQSSRTSRQSYATEEGSSAASLAPEDSPTVQELPADQEDDGIPLFEYWRGIKRALEERGCRVMVAKVPPFATIETRANVLNNFIEKKAAKAQRQAKLKNKIKVNLVAHSMGGLDCRYLISRLEQKNYEVVSLTTISTPHRGTYAADFVIKNAPKELIDPYFPSINQLTRAYMENANKLILDSPKVKYFSYGAADDPRLTSVFYVPWKLINEQEGPNDGMVSLRSAKWGKYMGHVEGVDHKDLINWTGGVRRLKLAMGVDDGQFQPILFYLGIADNLANNGL